MSIPCAGNCGYAITWHTTHCCKACERSSGKHGSRCERLPIEGKLACDHMHGEIAFKDPSTAGDSLERQRSIEDISSNWKDTCQRKGKGKGKGNGKGKMGVIKDKLKHKGVRHQHVTFHDDLMETDNKRPCAGGCGYAATWHPTHCCDACKRRSQTGHGCTHGPRCQKILMGTTASAVDGTLNAFDYACPVELEDGRRLTIQWNKGEAAQKVAMDFSDKHGIPPNEFLNIEERVKLVTVQRDQLQEEMASEETSNKEVPLERQQSSGDLASRGQGKGKGKGKGKFRGKGKGKMCVIKDKLKSKGLHHQHVTFHDEFMATDDKRPCAGGCGYAATWHPTHCCNACKRGSKTGHGCTHGPRCQKILMGTTIKRADGTPNAFDYACPVELEDGRRLTVRWNTGDAAQKVAMDYQHGIQPKDVLNIEERVKLVSSLGHWSGPAAPNQQMVHLQQEQGFGFSGDVQKKQVMD